MNFVLYEKQDQIGILTISNEKALNALNVPMLKELKALISDIESDAQIKVLILTGSGEKAFAAGADLNEMKDLSVAEAKAFSQFGSSVFRQIEQLSIPVLAAVNGYALGGGCELAMCADLRIAADTAVFGQPEIALGVTPGWGGTQRLARIVGESIAKELVFTSERISAERAKEIGLVNRVVEKSSLLPTVVEMAKKMAMMPATALRNSKKAICRGLDLPMDAALELESELFSDCFTCEDPNRLMNLFIQKRKN